MRAVWMMVVVCACVREARGEDILVIGDSYAEYAKTLSTPSWSASTDLLGAYCEGKAVVNVPQVTSIGGTTAEQWGNASNNMITQAFSPSYGSGYTHVWLSVGGNDFLGSNCTRTASEIKTAVESTISRVKAAAPPGIQIVMLGYCQMRDPAVGESECPSATTATIANLRDGLTQVAAADSAVTYVDSTEACYGSLTAWSDTSYLLDSIHLNSAGYEKYFFRPAVQAAFGCFDGHAATAACVQQFPQLAGVLQGDMSNCADLERVTVNCNSTMLAYILEFLQCQYAVLPPEVIRYNLVNFTNLTECSLFATPSPSPSPFAGVAPSSSGSPSSDTSDNGGRSSSSNTGAVVGGVLGALSAAVGGLSVVYYRKRTAAPKELQKSGSKVGGTEPKPNL